MWVVIRYGVTLLAGVFLGRFILPRVKLTERLKELLWARWGWQ
jgi:hypothetical protein